MLQLQKKIDFKVIIKVNGANPNGDPFSNNEPRILPNGHGFITDVSLKRKIRDYIVSSGKDNIFVQADYFNKDGCSSLKERAISDEHGLGKDAFNGKKTDAQELKRLACQKWFDVRAFGQLFAYAGNNAQGVSVSLRGPVTIHNAISTKIIEVNSVQITKSVNNEGDGKKKSSDTMGIKYVVYDTYYVVNGSISPFLCDNTGFSKEDAELFKESLVNIFSTDSSASRPEGSMVVKTLFWWEHRTKRGDCLSHTVHNSVKVADDGSYTIDEIEGLSPEIISPF